MSWGTGKAGLLPAPPADGAAATVVLERADQLAAAVASGLAGPQSVVFAPAATDDADPADAAGGPTVVRYEGSLSDSGGEFSVGSSFFLQSQTYGVSPYMSVVGPTLVRIADETDFQFYLDDADRARQAGAWSDFLTHPVIQLTDVCALGGGPAADGPRWRLHVAASGAVSTSPHGSPLGTLGDSPEQLERAWTGFGAATGGQGCPVCLGGVLDQRVRAQALAARPWLGRYLAALDAIRDLRARGLSEPRVSGFGGRLLPELAGPGPAADAGSAAAPLLLWTDQAAFVHTVDPSRTFRLDPALAPAVEALLCCGSAEDPERFADRGLLDRARASLRAVGVDLHRTVSVGAGV